MDAKYTVSEITKLIKSALEASFSTVWIEGEISDFKRHSSGHYYFTLKDENAQLSAVMWRGKNMSLFFTPRSGMKVLAKGRITVFEKSGRYQLDVDVLQPLGVGDLQLAFEELKKKLHSEGLFDESRKKAIPAYPDTIGIVTSPTGAAIRDIISVARRRYPGIQLILCPVRVQGEGSADEIAQALDDFNRFGKVDVIIAGRGGGSLEDLWSFNEEVVARAISRSAIPVISAVGHEIDFTIADLVSDKRAPTPSAAAEIAIPDAESEWERIKQKIQKVYRFCSDKINYLSEKIDLLENSHALKMPVEVLKQSALQLDLQLSRLEASYKERFTHKSELIDQIEKRLVSLDPEAVLNRGYSITYRSADGSIVTDSSTLKIGEDVQLKFAKGGALGAIKKIH